MFGLSQKSISSVFTWMTAEQTSADHVSPATRHFAQPCGEAQTPATRSEGELLRLMQPGRKQLRPAQAVIVSSTSSRPQASQIADLTVDRLSVVPASHGCSSHQIVTSMAGNKGGGVASMSRGSAQIVRPPTDNANVQTGRAFCVDDDLADLCDTAFLEDLGRLEADALVKRQRQQTTSEAKTLSTAPWSSQKHGCSPNMPRKEGLHLPQPCGIVSTPPPCEGTTCHQAQKGAGWGLKVIHIEAKKILNPNQKTPPTRRNPSLDMLVETEMAPPDEVDSKFTLTELLKAPIASIPVLPSVGEMGACAYGGAEVFTSSSTSCGCDHRATTAGVGHEIQAFNRPRQQQFSPRTINRPTPSGYNIYSHPSPTPAAQSSIHLGHPQPYTEEIAHRTPRPCLVDPWLAALLRPHQLEGVAFLLKALVDGNRAHPLESDVCFGAILADHMGLGKTLTSLATLYAMIQAGIVGGSTGNKALLVAPPSLLGQWSLEIKKYFGNRMPHLIASNGLHGRKGIHALHEFKSSRFFFLLLSYDLAIREEAMKLLAALPLELLVCDEAQRLKNPRARAYMALDSLPCKRRLVLTGTPLQNHLWEFHALLTFVGAGPFIGNKQKFSSSYVKPIERAQTEEAGRADKEVADRRLAELRQRLAPIMLRRGAEINKDCLPPLVQLVICCNLTRLQADLYNFFISSRAELNLKTVPSGREGSDAALAIIKLLQKTCAHPFSVYFEHNDLVFKQKQKIESPPPSMTTAFDAGRCDHDSNDHNHGHGMPTIADLEQSAKGVAWPQGFDPRNLTNLWQWSGKMLVLREILRSCRDHGEKVVVASAFTTLLDFLEEMCRQMGWRIARLDGKVLPSHRSEIVEDFNRPTSMVFVFLLSTMAGGSGLNLVGASRLVLMEPSWNPATDKQVCGRVWRPGQAAEIVHTYRLLSACTLEERIYSRQLKKLEVERGMLDPNNDGCSEASQQKAIGDGNYINELFEPSSSTWSDVFEQMGDTQTKTVEHLTSARLEGVVNLDGGRWLSHIHEIRE